MLKMYVNVIETKPEEQVIIERVEDNDVVIAQFDLAKGLIDLSPLDKRAKETIRVYHNNIMQGDYIIKSVIKPTEDGIHFLNLDPMIPEEA